MRSLDEVIDRMVELGFEDRSAAHRALDAALGAIGEALTADEAKAFSDRLPEPCARIVRDAGFSGVIDGAELYDRARRRAGAEPGRGREQTQIAIRALAAELDEEVRVRLAHSLPVEIGTILWPEAYAPPPPHAEAAHSPPLDTLATGRPGSRRPISESHADSTQSGSVGEANPHGDTKLSSARDVRGQTFSRGKPPAPARPVSDAHDRSKR